MGGNLFCNFQVLRSDSVVRKSRVWPFQGTLSPDFSFLLFFSNHPSIMLGRTLGYSQDDGHDIRPHKRLRKASTPVDSFPMDIERRPFADETAMQDLSQNSRLETLPTIGSPANRGRAEEKNTRKLSCKECRRWAIIPLLIVDQPLHQCAISVCQVETQGKNTKVPLTRNLKKSFLRLTVWSCFSLPSEFLQFSCLMR